MSSTAYYWDALSLEHDTGPNVESVARAERVRPENIRKHVPDLDDRPVEEHDAPAWIRRVHDGAYHDWVKRICDRGGGLLDQADTVACPRSYDAAIASVNAALTAADAVMTGQADNAFAAMRPPGHHALPDRAMGFCLFANISILARYLQQEHGAELIAIIDFDVHHGNGTQHIFYDDPSVFFVSLHQHPLWPMSGLAHEQGDGPGKGTTLNVPIAPHTSEEDYLDIYREQVLPSLGRFKPDVLLISAGFDAHADDPLAQLMLTETAYATMTDSLRQVADESCDGRIISLLEGGYDLSALECSVAAHVRSLMA